MTTSPSSRPPRRQPRLPDGVDPDDGAVIFDLPMADRVDIFRMLTATAQRSADHHVRAMARLIGGAIAQGRPQDALRDAGIVTHGGQSPASAQAVRERDRLLRQLWENMPEWATLSARRAAGEMRAAFRRYESDVWPRDKRNDAPPDEEPRRTWWMILHAKQRVPTEGHLAEILTAGSNAF